MLQLNETLAAGRQAVVIGASVAGLVAARVLVNHFDRVVLIERDRFPTRDGPRKGVPQGQHRTYFVGLRPAAFGKLVPWCASSAGCGRRAPG